MKLKAEMLFKDKYTGKEYAEGSIIEVSDERGEELLSDVRRLVTKVAEDEPKAEKKPKKKTTK